MKIENSVTPLSSGKTEGVQRGSGSQPTKSSGSVGRKDSANLSEEAKALAKARMALDEVPEIRSDRVEELKQSIENGTYSVPVDKLASSLMRHINFNA